MIPAWLLILPSIERVGEFLFNYDKNNVHIHIEGKYDSQWRVSVRAEAQPYFAWGMNNYPVEFTNPKKIISYYLVVVLNQLSEHPETDRTDLLRVIRSDLE